MSNNTKTGDPESSKTAKTGIYKSTFSWQKGGCPHGGREGPEEPEGQEEPEEPEDPEESDEPEEPHGNRKSETDPLPTAHEQNSPFVETPHSDIAGGARGCPGMPGGYWRCVPGLRQGQAVGNRQAAPIVIRGVHGLKTAHHVGRNEYCHTPHICG